MSEYQAILALDPAIKSTKKRFWPIQPGKIWRLLIISFFIGAWITGPFPQDVPFSDIPGLSYLTVDGNTGVETGQIIGIVIGILAILLVYSLFSSIFQFIFVDYLSSGTEWLLPSFRSRIGMGFRLLVFYLVIIFVIGLCAAVAIVFIAIPQLVTDPDNPARFLVALLYTLTGLLIMIIPAWIVTIITTDFVVPVMIIHNCGIILGWKTIIKEFSGRWDETAIYLLIKIIINLVAGVIVGIILVGIIEGLGFSSTLLIPGINSGKSTSLVEILPAIIIMGCITLVVMTPVVTFLKYYSLIFLEFMADAYTLLPEVFKQEDS
ncbi:MAG: hypothetical protein GXY48_11950 [Methanomicrobiales archaeon]|nr:hypothetical protein [Methanomicrobiales archaeon]